MAKVLSDTSEFVDGFVEECYKKGFSELQAAELLKTASRLELIEAKDEHFMAGMEKASAPYSAMTKALGMPWKIPVGPRGLLAGGAMAVGAAIPTFNRPEPFGTNETALSGAGKGALAGGALGTAIAGLSLMGNKGKGGYSYLRRFLQEANPNPKHFVQMPHGGRVAGGYDFKPQAPFIAAGKALSQPRVISGLRKGVGYGGAAGLGIGLKDSMGGGGFSGMNYGSYSPLGESGKSTGSAATDAGSIYSVPRTLKETYAPGASSAAATAAGGAAVGGVVGSMRAAQERVKELDLRINEMRKTVAQADKTNPNALLRAHDTEREIRRLMKDKDAETRNMNRLVTQMSKEQSKYQSAASQDYELATRKHQDAETGFNRHMSLLNGGNGTWYNNGWTAPLLAKLFNSRERAGMQAENMNQYDSIRTQAQEAMGRSLF